MSESTPTAASPEARQLPDAFSNLVDPQLRQRLQDSIGGALAKSLKRAELAESGSVPVGLTPKEVLYERGTLRLYHYLPQTDEVYRVPIIIVMATTNKAFLFDLMPGQSMVEFLIQRGFDVYMIDWAEPLPEERGLNIASYTHDFLPTCVEKVCADSGEDEVSMLGYCQGGVLSVIYAATHADGPVKNLTLFTTPVDFHKMELSQIWSDPRFMDVDQAVDTLGIIPVEMITAYFDMLRPAQRTAGQLRLWEQLLDDDFVASYRVLERWGDETLPLAGEYYRETTKELSWGNKLFTGELVVNGDLIDLSAIKVPAIHAIAQHDHIVPYESSRPLLGMLGSTDTEEVLLKGGHVSLVAGPRAQGRLWPKIESWLAERSV